MSSRTSDPAGAGESQTLDDSIGVTVASPFPLKLVCCLLVMFSSCVPESRRVLSGKLLQNVPIDIINYWNSDKAKNRRKIEIS